MGLRNPGIWLGGLSQIWVSGDLQRGNHLPSLGFGFKVARLEASVM